MAHSIALTKNISTLIIILLLTACSSLNNRSDTAENSVENDVEYEESLSQLTYFDSEVFDQGVSKQMTVPNRYIIIDFPEQVTLSSIPPRLETWLQRISHNEGTVELEPISEGEQSKSLGLLAEPLINLIFEAYFSNNPDEMDQLASQYNIRIYYMKDSGVIKNILFYPNSNNGSGE